MMLFFFNRFLFKYLEYLKVNEFIEIGFDDVVKDFSKKNMFILEIYNNLSCIVRGNQDVFGNLVEYRFVLVQLQQIQLIFLEKLIRRQCNYLIKKENFKVGVEWIFNFFFIFILQVWKGGEFMILLMFWKVQKL